LELSQGDESPWNIQTTIIVHSKVTPIDNDNMWVNSTQYMYLAPDKCLYYPYETFQAPMSVVNLIDNITLNGTEVVDGENCLILADPYGDKIDVRMRDMAVVRMSVPRSIMEAPPFFQLFGQAKAFSWINLRNIQLGPVNSNYFKPPNVNCTAVPFNFLKHILNSIKSSPSKDKAAEKVNKKDLESKQKAPKVSKVAKVVNQNKEADPPVPQLAQQFTAQFQFNATWYNNIPFSAQGTLGFDYVNSGFFLKLDRLVGQVPLFLQTTFIVTPDRDGIEILQYGKDGPCWSYLYLQWLWTYLIPQFKLPKDIMFIGTRMIDGKKANGWYLDKWSEGTNIWIRDGDNAIVLIEYTYYTVKFSNIVLKVEANRYARPPQCAELNNWNHNFASHLFWGWCYPWC